jgi:hypothetical protein
MLTIHHPLTERIILAMEAPPTLDPEQRASAELEVKADLLESLISEPPGPLKLHRPGRPRSGPVEV